MNQMNVRNQIKSVLAREGKTMTQLLDQLSRQYGQSSNLPNLSAKLSRDTIRYREVQQIADVLGYDLVWHKRSES